MKEIIKLDDCYRVKLKIEVSFKVNFVISLILIINGHVYIIMINNYLRFSLLFG